MAVSRNIREAQRQNQKAHVGFPALWAGTYLEDHEKVRACPSRKKGSTDTLHTLFRA